MTNKFNVYEAITANIITALEAGVAGAKLPWHVSSTANLIPVNAVTGKEYSGSNVMNLWVTAHIKSYSSNRWATFKQWAEIGATVKEGEKSTVGIFFSTFEKEGKNGAVERIPVARAFWLFNAAQVEGDVNAPAPAPLADLTTRITAADAAIAATGAAIIEGGCTAYYRPSTDEVNIPVREAFTGTETSSATEGYYSTLLHELAHWTGAKKRLDRKLGNAFGSEGYALEELVAELAAAFLCARLGISNEPRADHAQYLGSWLKALKNDNRAIVQAASAASKASDYILAYSAPQEAALAA